MKPKLLIGGRVCDQLGQGEGHLRITGVQRVTGRAVTLGEGAVHCVEVGSQLQDGGLVEYNGRICPYAAH